MLKWLLIVSITMVSTSMLVFASAYLAILSETQHYYKQNRTNILLLSNSFNILYLIVTPFIFSSLKRHYSILVIISAVLTAVGCMGRYLCADDYKSALIMSSLVAVGHIPIITAPYGLLDLFSEEEKGYAASIPLFVPTLGINFSIIYGMSFIASSGETVDMVDKITQINNLNFIIAVMGFVSCTLAVIFMLILKKQIRRVNQDSCLENNLPFLKSIRHQFKGGRVLMLMLICWGVILGLNWTYGGMFEVFLSETELTNKQIAMIGLYANLSSIIFSNLGNWISAHCKLSHRAVIFILNLSGLIASMVMQASSSQKFSQINSIYVLIAAIIILRAGFSSFVSLALIELGHCGPSVLISSIFFYVANASNLVGNYLVDMLANSTSLAIMAFSVWFCMLIVDVSYNKISLEIQQKQLADARKGQYDEMMQSSQMEITVSDQIDSKIKKQYQAYQITMPEYQKNSQLHQHQQQE